MSRTSPDGAGIFQAIYDREINFAVSCFWDGGFEVKLGDEMNGWKETGHVDTWAEVAPWLEAAALRHFPFLRLVVTSGPPA